MAAVYFDSGTTNTRIYVMDENFRVIASETRSIGSKDSAIRKSNHPLLWAMKKMYENALEICGLEDRDIEGIYISGMATSPYGIVEIPHREIPIKAEGLAKAIVPYYEEICFGRTIYLIPGLKTNASEFIYVNNVRGEETELIGALEELKKRNLRGGTAVILPGSHTHAAYVEEERICGLLSNFSGELFHALRTSTILAPVLTRETDELDENKVREGYQCLADFGFNRAVYIAHAMRIFNEGTEKERFSYSEGVINGGIRLSLEYYRNHVWKDCQQVAVLGNRFMYRLYDAIFEGSGAGRLLWLTDEGQKPFSVRGAERLIKLRGENGGK